MKNIIYLSTLFLVVLFFQSCEDDTVPTRDVIIITNEPPTITLLSEIPDRLELYVEDIYALDVMIEAKDGIDSIIVNDKLIQKYGNGQLKYSTGIPIEMADVDSMLVELKVVDDNGLTTMFPPFYVFAKGRIPSPFLIMNWSSAYTTVYASTDDEFLVLPLHAGTGYNTSIGWTDIPVESDIEGMTNILMGAPWQGKKDGYPEIAFNWGVDAPDGEKSMIITPIVSYMFNLMSLGTPIPEKLIADVVAVKRKFMIDVYVDNSNSVDFNLTDHSEIVLNLANVAKFHNDVPKTGQDDAMSARITKVGEWETLTFELDPNSIYGRTMRDVENNEVDMLFILVAPHFNNEELPIPDAKFYFQNLRIEKNN